MTDASVDLRQISDFARETGVTVRALRLYIASSCSSPQR